MPEREPCPLGDIECADDLKCTSCYRIAFKNVLYTNKELEKQLKLLRKLTREAFIDGCLVHENGQSVYEHYEDWAIAGTEEEIKLLEEKKCLKKS